jgi:hypothetical protein
MPVVSLRPVGAADLPFLLQLYGSTRAAELTLVPWNDEQRAAFIKLQYDGQTTFYQSEYPDAVHSIVLCDGEAVGRLYVHRRPHEIRILDVTLLTSEAAAIAGNELLPSLMAEAVAARLPLNIHLEPFNAMQPCFERLGFVKVSDSGTHALYEWRVD